MRQRLQDVLHPRGAAAPRALATRSPGRQGARPGAVLRSGWCAAVGGRAADAGRWWQGTLFLPPEKTLDESKRMWQPDGQHVAAGAGERGGMAESGSASGEHDRVDDGTDYAAMRARLEALVQRE